LIVQEFISPTLLPLTGEHTGDDAWNRMIESQVYDLPVVDEAGKLAGFVVFSPELIKSDTSVIDLMEPITSSALNENDSIWKACKVLSLSEWESYPVVNDEQEVVGVILNQGLINQLADSLSLQQEGNYLILEMSPQDYSMARIAGIIEQEDVRVLLSWVDHLPESNRIRLTLKVNTDVTERLESALHRFGYEVVAVLGNRRESGWSSRLDSLMKYLDI
jgi:CBS domain-containing protein